MDGGEGHMMKNVIVIAVHGMMIETLAWMTRKGFVVDLADHSQVRIVCKAVLSVFVIAQHNQDF